MFHKRRYQGSQKGRPRKRFKSGAYLRRSSDDPAGSWGNRSRALRPFYGKSAGSTIIRQPSSLPDRLYIKLRYRELVNFSQISGNLAENVYRGNSLFDPDFTGTGGQPYGYDQWTQLYAYYTVLASKVELLCDLNAGSPANTTFGATPVPISTGFGVGGQELAMESPYAKFDRVQAGNAGYGGGKLSHYMSTSKILGIKRAAVETEDNYSAAVSTNPTNQWFWHIWNFVPGLQTQSVNMTVILTYYCVFEQRQVLTVS